MSSTYYYVLLYTSIAAAVAAAVYSLSIGPSRIDVLEKFILGSFWRCCCARHNQIDVVLCKVLVPTSPTIALPENKKSAPPPGPKDDRSVSWRAWLLLLLLLSVKKVSAGDVLLLYIRPLWTCVCVLLSRSTTYSTYYMTNNHAVYTRMQFYPPFPAGWSLSAVRCYRMYHTAHVFVLLFESVHNRPKPISAKQNNWDGICVLRIRMQAYTMQEVTTSEFVNMYWILYGGTYSSSAVRAHTKVVIVFCANTFGIDYWHEVKE